ncbi:hypothetical protein CRYUN_Cryun16bG0065700 [Craigia yunnanensis]
MRDLNKKGLYLSILLILILMIMIPSSTSHSSIGSPESNSLSFFPCNGSSAECFGLQDQDDLGFEFLMESETSEMVLETRRMLQQKGKTSTNTLKPADAACGRDKFGYLCTPPANKDVKRSENCKGDTYNRGCHQQLTS